MSHVLFNLMLYLTGSYSGGRMISIGVLYCKHVLCCMQLESSSVHKDFIRTTCIKYNLSNKELLAELCTACLQSFQLVVQFVVQLVVQLGVQEL